MSTMDTLINSMKLIKMYAKQLEDIYTPVEQKNKMHKCSSCNSIIKMCDNTDYIYKCNNECTCETRYCQIEHIINRNSEEHDEMINITKELNKQINIRNKSIEMINDTDHSLEHCSHCNNVINIFMNHYELINVCNDLDEIILF